VVATWQQMVAPAVPGEPHSLPLDALAAALAEAGIPAIPLGARAPSDAIRDAARRTGPAVVVLWAQLPTLARPRVFADLAVRGRTLLALGPVAGRAAAARGDRGSYPGRGGGRDPPGGHRLRI
jgi:hypothetical protein